jgi:photosystem II stability/assembly factor-like uncharacterized protein
MRSLQFKVMLGGLAVILAILACSIGSPVTPTIIPVPPLPLVATDTFAPIQAIATATVMTIPPLPSPSIHSLTMLDAENGWAVVEGGVARTTDGGTTWHNASPTGLGDTSADSFFLDSANAWLTLMGADPFIGKLYHTTDGGATWNSVEVPFGGGSLYFVDVQNGWELIGLSAGMSHEAVAIYRTSDGGATWSKVFTDDPGAPGSSDSLPLVGDKNGITALDPEHGWVTGSQPSSDFIYIYASQDGGATWAHQETAFPTGYSGAMANTDLPVFFGASEAVLPVRLYADNVAADFYVSHDAGQTWSATTPVAQGGHMSAASATDFFVWDGGSALNASHDAGISWSSVTPNINIKDSMVSMQFVDASTGWVLTSDASSHRTLYQTSDGGATWNILIP